MLEPLTTDRTQLARLVGARLVHDLSGPLGTITAAAGLAPGTARSDAMLAETMAELVARGRLYAAVFGEAEPVSAHEMPALLAGAPGAHRVTFQITPGPNHSAPLAQLLLTAAMLAAEALPRGGSVAIGPGPGGGTVVLPEGQMVAWPHGLLERLGGLPPPQADTPRSLLAAWLVALAHEAGCHLSIGLGGVGTPPLLLRPTR